MSVNLISRQFTFDASLVTTTRSSPQGGQHFPEMFQSQHYRSNWENCPQPSATSARRESASLANAAPAALTSASTPADVEAIENLLYHPTVDNVEPLSNRDTACHP